MTEMKVRTIPIDEWKILSEDAHMTCFGEKREWDLERIDYAIGGFVNQALSGYITCMEMDAKTVYIQYGGALPNYEKTPYVARGYRMMLNYLCETYDRAWTRIDADNTSMLKMALSFGWKIVGTYNFKGKCLVELENNFRG